MHRCCPDIPKLHLLYILPKSKLFLHWSTLYKTCKLNKSLIFRCFHIYTHMLWSGVAIQLWVLLPMFRDFQLCSHYAIHLSVSGMYLVRSHVSKREEGSPHRQEQLLWRRERIHFHPWAGLFVQTAHVLKFTELALIQPPLLSLYMQLYKKFEVPQPAESLGHEKDWNIDLIPKFFLASGKILVLLIWFFQHLLF